VLASIQFDGVANTVCVISNANAAIVLKGRAVASGMWRASERDALRKRYACELTIE